MQKHVFQIALASLIHNPGTPTDWEKDVASKLGKLPDYYSEIVELASKLCAGNREAEDGTTKNLQSIFDHLSLSGKQDKPEKSHHFVPVALSLGDDMFFPRDQQKLSETESDAGRLLGDLKKEMPQSFPGPEGYQAYLEQVLAVLHRFASNLPSSVLPDVSLYDHRRLTAALAVCLLDKAGDGGAKFNIAEDEDAVLLVGGDISGIQDFIYTLRAKGAARTLRGRSFYLQLLTEAILRFSLQELDLPYSNVIYSGGGHFFLLAPISKKEKLDEIQRKITETLLKHHRTSLYLALGCAAVPHNGFGKGSFPKFWGAMHAAMADRKKRRYSELGAEMYSGIFEIPEKGGNPENTCDACGEDHRALKTWKFEGEDDGKICTLCASFEELGRELTRSEFLAIGFGDSTQDGAKNATDVLAGFGMTFRFVENDGGTAALHGKETVLWSFDDPVDGKWPSMSSAAKWLRYTANRVPAQKSGEFLTFDELQDEVEGGFKRLGVLRMDVDNLGELFKRGLGEDATLSRLATLSFRISLFFEGWLQKLCEKDKRAGKIYTVYAGGDDLFLLGPWDLIPGLAKDIVKDFNKYTGDNEDIHASAGMAFIHGKYPVYQAAEDAGDALDTAKATREKNAFTFLGKRWNWTEFYEIVEKHGRLTELVAPKEKDKKAAPQAILQVLQQLALEEEQHDKVKGLHVWGRWIWMGMYQLTRMQERNRGIALEIKAISDEMKDNNYQNIEKWGFAARWTELKLRSR